MKVLISGAGPAGLTAAYWLKRYGYNPTIVERAPSLLVGGYKIDVRGGGASGYQADGDSWRSSDKRCGYRRCARTLFGAT
jgi:uncharacterized protein with NAD-binding domain and iron-sulfur cluster